MRRASLARPSTRSATAVGATLVMLGAGLLLPTLGASAEEPHGARDHRVVICHHVEGHGGTYLRSVVDVNGIHGHGRHPLDIIGAQGGTDLGCPGPTVSEVPDQPDHTAKPSPTATPTPRGSQTCPPGASATPTGSGSGTSTPSQSVSPTGTPAASGTPTPVDPGTGEATTDPSASGASATATHPASDPVPTDPPTDPPTAAPVQPGLAGTGSNPVPPAGAGLLLLLLGAGALVLGRPRGAHA